MQQGTPVLVSGTIKRRVQRITHDYTQSTATNTSAEGLNPLEEGLKLLGLIKSRLGGERVAEIERLVRNGDLQQAVEQLLVEYYDPLYRKQLDRAQPFSLEVNGDDPSAAATLLANSLAYDRYTINIQ